MNRGIEKKPIEEPTIKGKNSKANPIRVDVFVPNKTVERLTELSEAMKIEKAATVRMLLWFSMRFAPPVELSRIASETSFKSEGQSVNRLDTRITQEMLDEIESFMKIDKLSKSRVIKTLLYWALANIGKYTFEDMLAK